MYVLEFLNRLLNGVDVERIVSVMPNVNVSRIVADARRKWRTVIRLPQMKVVLNLLAC